jgi:hypothetical protein
MADLAIVLALVVLNALAQASYVRWRRRHRGKRPAARPVAAGSRPGFAYPMHPSLGLAELSEHAITVRPAGIDW